MMGLLVQSEPDYTVVEDAVGSGIVDPGGSCFVRKHAVAEKGLAAVEGIE